MCGCSQGLEGDVVVRGSDDGTGSPFTLVWLDNEANKQPSSKLITHLGSVATQTAARQHALRRTHYLGGCVAGRRLRVCAPPCSKLRCWHHPPHWLLRYADVDTQWRLKDMVSAPLARSLQAVAQQVMDAKESPQAKVPLMRPVLPNSIERDTNTCVHQRADTGRFPSPPTPRHTDCSRVWHGLRVACTHPNPQVGAAANVQGAFPGRHRLRSARHVGCPCSPTRPPLSPHC